MKRRYKYPLIGLGIVWLLAILSLIPRFIELRGETREVLGDVSGYSNGLVSQQYAEAYQYSSKDFRVALPYNAFVALYQGLQGKYGTLKSVKRQSYEVNGHGTPMVWKAVVDEDFVYEKETIRFEFVLHKEDGHWAISSAEEL